MVDLSRRSIATLFCLLGVVVAFVWAKPAYAQGGTIYLPLLVKSGVEPPALFSVVFVSRQTPPKGSIYLNVPKQMPGVGPYSRFTVAAPGKLIIREANGVIRVLVDGSQSGPASLNLIDVNAPDVSYDGKTIVF